MSSIIKYRNINVATEDPYIVGSAVKVSAPISADDEEETLMDKLENLSSKIEDAEKRYNEIVLESDKIMFETNNKAEKILNEAKEDGQKQGYIEGLNKAKEEIDETKLALQDEYDIKLAEIETEKKEFLKKTKNELSDIFKTAFTKVFENEIKYSNDLLETLIIKGLRELSDEKEVRILLSEDDYRKLNKDSLQRKVGVDFSDKRITVSYDKSINNGSCLLETSLGFVDASLDNLANLVSQIVDGAIIETNESASFMNNETNNIE